MCKGLCCVKGLGLLGECVNGEAKMEGVGSCQGLYRVVKASIMCPPGLVLWDRINSSMLCCCVYAVGRCILTEWGMWE